ncbi:hypothetical protein K438DRAFT_1254078 [Mycena galopus ATCC 62051]|nr:hypothetical protein K438DRAFT_805431 [Mycena galopus ATCC 62051]KAF8179280.1 hypothetical protein K438DRAFT_1254078 [Mycena galopus ATCC 62051]
MTSPGLYLPGTRRLCQLSTPPLQAQRRACQPARAYTARHLSAAPTCTSGATYCSGSRPSRAVESGAGGKSTSSARLDSLHFLCGFFVPALTLSFVINIYRLLFYFTYHLLHHPPVFPLFISLLLLLFDMRSSSPLSKQLCFRTRQQWQQINELAYPTIMSVSSPATQQKELEWVRTPKRGVRIRRV